MSVILRQPFWSSTHYIVSYKDAIKMYDENAKKRTKEKPRNFYILIIIQKKTKRKRGLSSVSIHLFRQRLFMIIFSIYFSLNFIKSWKYQFLFIFCYLLNPFNNDRVFTHEDNTVVVAVVKSLKYVRCCVYVCEYIYIT